MFKKFTKNYQRKTKKNRKIETENRLFKNPAESDLNKKKLIILVQQKIDC